MLKTAPEIVLPAPFHVLKPIELEKIIVFWRNAVLAFARRRTSRARADTDQPPMTEPHAMLAGIIDDGRNFTDGCSSVNGPLTKCAPTDPVWGHVFLRPASEAAGRGRL